VTIPVAAAAGDLAICSVGAERTEIPVLTWPTGSPAPVVGRAEAYAGGSMAGRIEAKVLAAGDLSGTVTATVSATTKRMAVALIVLRGAAAIDATSFTNATAKSQPVGDFIAELPDVTPTVDNSWVVALMPCANSPGAVRTFAFTPSSAYTERIDVTGSSASNNAGSWIATQAISGGAGSPVTGATATETDRFSYLPTTLLVPPAGALPAGWHEIRLFTR
jgi:hypothetical protein